MFKTEQENFWAGEFGKEYILRNKDKQLISANTAFFSKVFSHTSKINSVLELGSNIGLNLIAIKHLLQRVNISAVEINKDAARELKNNLPETEIYNTSILEFQTDIKWDLVFTKGVLIHINPDSLPKVYKLMHEISSKYIPTLTPNTLESPLTQHLQIQTCGNCIYIVRYSL